MRRVSTLALLLVLAQGCASSGAPNFRSELHANYADLRPVMVALRIEADDPALERALYRGLIDKGYSVLAPGTPVGTEAGIFRAELLEDERPFEAEATFENPAGVKIYAMSVEDLDGTLADLADALLLDLPAK